MPPYKILSLPLSPPGAVARRGSLALLITKAPSYARRPDGAQEATLVCLTGLTRSGEIRTYRPAAREQGYDSRVERDWREIDAFVDASSLDPERAIEVARAHTWPGHPDSPRHWESFAEAKEALRVARRPTNEEQS
ncbi:hypothetical protein BBK14_33475 [Parafrankia soli]|uniref:Uncharacterized protein n=1 Tax=Parafrankia soli TaxID=2599596 RepID=A0A1S1QJV5_9ACTN|nr:hypothetical protein [Parafrankia soli]OHV35048.1 hypothetical protein BBK14_33475 [Parafrankia soli]